jgi:hypothetical protein
LVLTAYIDQHVVLQGSGGLTHLREFKDLGSNAALTGVSSRGMASATGTANSKAFIASSRPIYISESRETGHGRDGLRSRYKRRRRRPSSDEHRLRTALRGRRQIPWPARRAPFFTSCLLAPSFEMPTGAGDRRRITVALGLTPRKASDLASFTHSKLMETYVRRMTQQLKIPPIGAHNVYLDMKRDELLLDWWYELEQGVRSTPAQREVAPAYPPRSRKHTSKAC